ncbi:cell division cycle protein 16 homolog isoform X2 [Thrips palmi]|uniref:Cell division cycle protein 16 homolog isoform X2 n=1 Tax=Thrips palmi TaxID=161013 RepID=A0A6P8Y309_THRPL|nr:cell division cycle protein 16 homolog isoform X2 [Thrips palmi]
MAAAAAAAGEMDCEMKNINELNVNIDTFRKLVRSYLDLHQYNAALFWADKVVSLSNDDPKDVYWLAQCMFHLRQYHRAVHLIRSRDLDKAHPLCHYLTVRSLLAAGCFSEALQLLTIVENDTSLSQTARNFTIDSPSEGPVDPDCPRNLESSILFLKGQVLEAMDNRELAAESYRQALGCDVYCYEAFDALVQHHMLSSWEEMVLLDSIPYSKQCSTPAEASFVRQLYEIKLNKYQGPYPEGSHPSKTVAVPPSPSPGLALKGKLSLDISDDHTGSQKPTSTPLYAELQTNSVVKIMANNLDVLVSKAERLFYNCKFQSCLKLTEEVLKKDPYHSNCLSVHIGCLVELKKSNQLFYLAHRLVDLHPEMAISWFAVGCYYYLIGKSDPARRYLTKATVLDRLFGPAWLAFGHSFAAENEHDQAMSAYFKASQLMKGCHLPLLYIGLECGLTNSVKLADKFFLQAQNIAPQDPFVMHELGVIAFQNQEYERAEKHFEDALKLVRSIDDSVAEKWEPLLNNLGHVSRKRGKFSEALDYHQQALVLQPLNSSTFSAMGYAHAMMGNTLEAVDCFHKALGLRRDDTFSTTMLNYVIEQLVDDPLPFEGAPEKMPVFKSKKSTTPRIISYDDQNPDESSMNVDEDVDGVTPAIMSDTPNASDLANVTAGSSNLSFEVEMQDTSSQTLDNTS